MFSRVKFQSCMIHLEVAQCVTLETRILRILKDTKLRKLETMLRTPTAAHMVRNVRPEGLRPGATRLLNSTTRESVSSLFIFVASLRLADRRLLKLVLTRRALPIIHRRRCTSTRSSSWARGATHVHPRSHSSPLQSLSRAQSV